MDDDLFELQYADELDALYYLDKKTGHSELKPKRTLQFSSPCNERDLKSQAFSKDKYLNNEQSTSPLLVNLSCVSPHENVDSNKCSDSDVYPDIGKYDAVTHDPSFDNVRDVTPAVSRKRRAPPHKEEGLVTLPEDHKKHRRVFNSFPTANCCLCVTSFDGGPIYLTLKETAELEHEVDHIGDAMKQGQNLLPTPISDLREQLESERYSHLLQCPASELISPPPDSGFLDDRGMMDMCGGVSSSLTDVLWVDHHSPHCYMDLLSDECVNRMLLHWLKQWDYLVFKKELPLFRNERQERPVSDYKLRKPLQEVSKQLDEYKRPVQKVVLLCGPPGLGKTTLAHVVAVHSGYNVVEMNASDDRTVESFTSKIESATGMKALGGKDPRPNCLIIDEIDGAPQNAINVLLNVLRHSDQGGGKKKKKKSGDLLMRPVICICNDQYAASLRQLKQQALVMVLPPTDTSRLASRLSEVARKEGLKADVNVLMLMCERADNDIRFCLNTLQFACRHQTELSMQAILATSFGQKHSHKSLFDVWKEIFALPRPNRNRFGLDRETSNGAKLCVSSSSLRMQRIVDLVQANGESERVIHGLFENFLSMKCRDPRLTHMVMSMDWFCFVDGLIRYTQHSQDYSLMKYVIFLPAAFHFIYASSTPQRLSFPHVHFEVNTQLYSKQEKDGLLQLVLVMVKYNITYHQERSPEGQYSYVLEPQRVGRQLTYAAKQLIAREIEQEKMRKSEALCSSLSQCLPPSDSKLKQLLPMVKPIFDDKPRKNVFAGFTRTRRETKMAVDGLKEGAKRTPGGDILNTAIWYHFKEGYSNAVRTNVPMKNLL